MIPTFVGSFGAKVAIAATAAALFAGGAAGASATLGGPNVSAAVHSAIAGNPHGHQETGQNADASGAGTGHSHCSQATQKALQRLNELKTQGRPVDKAIKAIQNCGNGHSADPKTSGEHDGSLPDQTSSNAGEQSGNSSQGINNAGDQASTGMSHANQHAANGSGNAP